MVHLLRLLLIIMISGLRLRRRGIRVDRGIYSRLRGIRMRRVVLRYMEIVLLIRGIRGRCLRLRLLLGLLVVGL